MMKRRAIAGIACVGLLLVLVGGTDARVPSKRRVASAVGRAAEVKTLPPAVSRPAEVKTPPGVAPTAGAAAGVAAGVAGATALRVLTPAAAPAAEPPAPITAPATAPPAAPSAAAPAAATPAAAPPYTYNPAGKSDPFQPFVEVDLAVKKEKEKKAREAELKRAAASGKRPISPLEQKEIGQFRLVGIAGDDRRRTAIVVDETAKRIYPLAVGTHIGQNGGRIVSILSDRLIVEEPLPEQSEKTRKKQTRQITVLLHKEEEGKP